MNTFLFAGLAINLASREYTFEAAVSVLIILGLLTTALIAFTGYWATVLACLSMTLVALHLADQMKFELVRYHIQIGDAWAVLSQFLNGDFALLAQYPIQSGIALTGAVVTLAVLIIVARSERSLRARIVGSKRDMMLGCAATVGFVIAATQLTTSSYSDAIRNLHMNRLMGDQKPLRASVALIGFAEGSRLANLMSEPRLPPEISVPENCPDCPDLVVVHLESTFDPSLTKDFATMEPFGKLASKDIAGAYGTMRSSVWGGFSWITEFEVVCGLSHQLFGWSGRYTHYNVAPYLKGCLGTELAPLNYSGQVLYTARSSFIGVDKAFDNYGFSRFQDAEALQLPRRWQNITETVMFSKLLDRLKQKSEERKLIWLATTWNHGPHGSRYAKADLPGPYDPDRTSDPALADYVNRLNYTLRELERLKAHLRSTKRRTAVLFYGDHHPPFPKNYSASAPDEADYMTPYFMFRNYPVGAEHNETTSTPKTLGAEFLMNEFLTFAGLPDLPGFAAIKKATVDCRASQSECSNEAKNSLRRIFRQP